MPTLKPRQGHLPLSVDTLFYDPAYRTSICISLNPWHRVFAQPHEFLLKLLELAHQLANLLNLSIQQRQHMDTRGPSRIVKGESLPYVGQRKAQGLGLADEDKPL